MKKLTLLLLYFFPFVILSQVQSDISNDATNKTQALIDLYYSEGDNFYQNQNYEDAQKQFLKVDSIAKNQSYSDKNTVLAMVKRAQISTSTFSIDGTETANSLLELALTDAQKLNNEALINTVYKDLAYIKYLMKEYDLCKLYLDRALAYYLNTEETASVSRLYHIYSFYYIKVDSLKKAEDFRLERISYLRKHKDSIELAKAISSLGDFYSYRLKQYDKAMPYLKEAKVIYERTDDTLIRPYLYLIENLAISHAGTGNYELGYNYYERAYNLRKDIVRESNDVTTRRLEARFQAKEKEQEIALLKSEKQLSEQQKKNERNLFIGGIALIASALFFLLILYRNRRKNTEKLKELDKIKSKFFANISHEFRTPLTLISHPIEDILTDTTLSSDKRNKFMSAKRNSERLLSLVDQLLDLSKLEVGSLKLRISEGNILRYTSAIADAFTYAAEEKSISYLNEFETTETTHWFDKDAVSKIVINLISNAVKYTPEGGSISCQAKLTGNQFSFEVKNTGEGLTQTQLDHVFDRFYQVDEHKQGSGIGLALIKELIELHQGNIQVDSIPSEWTTFKVMLPVNKEAFQTSQIVEAHVMKADISKPDLSLSEDYVKEPISVSNDELPSLLIVEDNTDLRDLLASIFEMQYQVHLAKNGQEGIDLAQELIPDLIISDIMMPVKDGIALTKELKMDERSSHIPIILLTAKVGDINELEGLEIGADDYITKPFNAEILRTKVHNLISSRQQLQDRYSQELILMPKDIAITNIDEKFLEKVQVVLDDNLVESTFSVEEFSKAVGMSRMQLHRKIKALTGLSASEFIRSQRLKLAAQLLKQSDINISQVGYTVGFNDHSYFTKCFKELYQCTPTEYSKRAS